MNTLREIRETLYLNTQKSSQYRRIMRVFFIEYEKMNFQLYKEDIFEKVKKFSEFEEYDMNKLKIDLDSLEEWGNLTAIQDSKRVNTIAEFKNREYRYSMSDKAVIIERMTIELENIQFESKTLSTNYIPRMISALEQISFLFNNRDSQDKIKIYEAWRSLQEDFKQINQNYQDYLKEFYTKRTEEIMRTTEFLLYKEKFISILRTFIKELQKNSSKMEEMIKKVKNDENGVLELIIELEMKNQELDLSNRLLISEELKNKVRENIIGKWESLKNWFTSNNGRKSEYRQIMKITEEIIEKIVQEAFFITQRQNWGSSRKMEYKKFISLFIDCQDIKEAHKLAAHIFGVQRIRHFQLKPSTTISTETSVYYDEGGDKNYREYILESHNRTYKPKVEKIGFEDRRKLKEKLKLEYEEKLKNDKKMMLQYLDKGVLDISKLEGEVSSEFRIFILNLISIANLSSDRTGRTEYGQKYKLIDGKGYFTLKCEDGDLEMPKYIFEFLED